MMPKPSKIIKKGYDPPGNNYIALGSRSKDNSSSTATASTTATTTTTVLYPNPNELPISNSTIKQSTTNSNSSTNLLNQPTESNTILNNNSNSTSTNNNSKPIKLTTNNSSSNLQSLASNNTTTNSNNASNNNNSSNNNPFYLDSKTVRDEITKLLEKDDTNEKLIKIIKSLIINLRSPSNGSSSVLSSSSNTINKQQIQSQSSPQQQPDLNFLMALSVVIYKRPQLFVKQTSLVEFLCTNLLFTSKNPIQDKLSNSSTSSSNMLKSKSLQSLRPPSSPQQSLISIQPVICNMLGFIYENETTWPEIFVKAYVDDSLGERSWVDSPLCKDFVDNIKTAFCTRPIPFSVENSSLNSNLINNSNSNSSSDLQSLKNNEDSILELSGGVIDFTNKKTTQIPRYDSIRNEIEVLLVDLIRNYMSMNSKSQPVKRLLGQTVGTLGSASNSVNTIDNRNFLKLLQNTCGFGEIRAIALSKLESWLLNPKLDPSAQDLLLAICVNCNQGDQMDKDIISQIIKIKPKLKQSQHYWDCIRELIKLNTNNFETLIQLTVRNELVLQLQQLNLQQQQQPQQQQQITSSKNTHNLNLLQISFSTDGLTSSKILAQTMLKIILQRNGEDHMRSLRILLRDTVRNSRQDFDLIKFTNELISDNLIKKYFFSINGDSSQSNSTCLLFSIAGGLADFSMNQTRERYVNSVCDLITVCILVAITPQIKEAYLRRSYETRDILIKYYMAMSQIQSDSVTWLQSIFKPYDLNPTELVRCLFKILFMVDKPEQCYTIDNWPSEQERGTMFRVVSEIPVLSETLHQVLMMTQQLPDHMYMLMLCVEENLLKTASLVHIKDVYSLKLNKIEQFVDNLFNICLYKYQNPPTPLVVTVLYWRAWQILLLICALDPKNFGRIAWDNYPTLRLLMEMVMIDDYNFPPQCSITEDISIERFRSFETQADQMEKQEILDFENMFERKQGLGVKNESNSKLIGQVMRFDPTGPPRRPKIDTIQNIRKLNSEYKLGQLLCKNRQPDFLLMLIKRQNSKLSLPWLSSLIESNSDCLEVLPIQCICEFVWNLLSGTEEEIPLKKQLNIEQLINRIKTILTTDDLSDSTTIQQITDTFDYFLNKLCSDKQTIRYGSLKILNKLFLSSNCILDRLQIPPLPGQTQPQHQQQQIQIDLEHLINSFKQLSSYNICLKPLLVKYFRKALMVETNPNYLNLYLEFLFKQLLIDYKQQSELESSLKMQLDESENVSILIKNESFKTTYNEIGYDLADFFFKRDYYLNSIRLLNFENELIDENNLITLTSFLFEFSSLILKLNEINSNDDTENEDNFLIKNKQEFRRDRLDSNSFLLIENLKTNKFYYINEKLFNLIIYFVILIVKLSNLLDKNDKFNLNEFYDSLANIKLLNCPFNEALNQICIDHLLKLKFQSKQENESQLREYFKFKSTDTNTKPDQIFSLSFRLIDLYIDSISNDLNHLFKIISNKYGLSLLVSYLIIEKIEILFNKPDSQITNDLSIGIGMSVKSLNDIVQTYISKFKIFLEKNSDLSKYLIGVKLGEYLENLKNVKSAQNGNLDIEMSDAGKMKFFSIKKREKFGKKEIKTETKTNKILNNIQSEIDRFRKEKELKLKQDEIRDDISIVSDDEEENNTQLMRIINESNNQNLEFNLNKKLNDLSIDERIISISETILGYEDKKNEQSLLRRSRSSSSKIIKELNDSFNQSQNQTIGLKRCIIDILLDYLCHFDPQIVNKQFEVEFLLLFELRNVKYDSQNESKSGSELTQSFLLSLFLHQANWHKLYDCIQFILKDHDFFCKHDQKYSLNPTNILDFLTSLIHIPELWKGTESRIVKKSEEENVLNLTVKQTCIVIDFIIEEMFILYLIKNKKQTTSSNLDDLTDLDSLKQTLDKRIELLKHLFKNFKQKSQKENLFDRLLSHLNKQKYIFNKFNLSNLKNLTNDVQSKTIDDFNFLKLILNKHENFALNHLENVLHKIQTLFLYRIYLEESSIIYKITNSNRLFTDFYFQIDKPTQLDLKAHNLLNCFGEIEVNLSHNLTSSGIIGVAVSATSKKENQELVLFSKKQEAFMVDANFVCVKLASSHPFIFIRQLPMMEGLLQGRVGYSFEEFKKRKFEKLFHYVIDILNSLVPYVFHQKYIEYIESIISHYFDVFMSYCAENREFIGGLVSKFVEFLEKFINCDIKIGYCLIIRKYSQSISFLQKTYPDISSLKYLNSIQSIPFESIENLKNLTRSDLLKLMPKCLNNVNNLNQKLSMQLLSSKQLEPFINKLTNRNSFESVLSVLQELDVVSQRQPIILSHFVVYLQPLMIDSSDLVRDLAISLIMRHLRLNPKETFSFEQAFLECLNDSSSKVFNSIVKYLPELALLCSDKSQLIIKKAFQGASRHNIDISKQMTDSIRLLQLEKYVY